MTLDPPTILIVDDSPENLAAFTAVLQRDDRRIACARSGEEALRHLLSHDVALILMDVRLPGLDGYATARLIRQRPNTAAIPIIFITAELADQSQFLEGLASGAVDCIDKLVAPEVLQAKVSILLELFQKTRLLAVQSQTVADAAKRNELARELEIERDRHRVTQSELEQRVHELEGRHDAGAGGTLKTMEELERELERLRKITQSGR